MLDAFIIANNAGQAVFRSIDAVVCLGIVAGVFVRHVSKCPHGILLVAALAETGHDIHVITHEFLESRHSVAQMPVSDVLAELCEPVFRIGLQSPVGKTCLGGRIVPLTFFGKGVRYFGQDNGEIRRAGVPLQKN